MSQSIVQGGVNLTKLGRKLVTIIANPEVGEKCLVSLLDKYISKLPHKCDDDPDYF